MAETYDVYIYDEDENVVGQTCTTEFRVGDCARHDARFVVGVHEGWSYHCSGFEQADDEI